MNVYGVSNIAKQCHGEITVDHRFSRHCSLSLNVYAVQQSLVTYFSQTNSSMKHFHSIRTANRVSVHNDHMHDINLFFEEI